VTTLHTCHTLRVLALALATGGCTGLLGDFGAGPPGDSGITSDVGTPGSSGGDIGGPPIDGGDAARSDATPPDGASGDGSQTDGPPPPPPGKPGFDITSGGNASTSTNYTLIGAVAEAPGANIIIGTSPSYKLRGGVIAGTQ